MSDTDVWPTIRLLVGTAFGLGLVVLVIVTVIVVTQLLVGWAQSRVRLWEAEAAWAEQLTSVEIGGPDG